MITETEIIKEVEIRTVTEEVKVGSDDNNAVSFILIGMIITLIAVVIITGLVCLWLRLRSKRERDPIRDQSK